MTNVLAPSPMSVQPIGSLGENVFQDSVTVIVATFNRTEYLGECMASVLSQTHRPSQVILVDDGSDQDVASVIRPYIDRITYIWQPNAGRAAALNRALEAATGEWLWFFDDDDVALPGSISRRLNAARDRPDIDIVFSEHHIGHDDPNGRITQGRHIHGRAQGDEHLLINTMRNHLFLFQGTLVRRRCFDDIGGFDATFLRSADYEMTVRLLRRFKAVVLHEPTFIWRDHNGVRGPKVLRHGESSRKKIWMDFDGRLGKRIRAELALGEYLAPPVFGRALTLCEMRFALLTRMSVMASKGLVNEALDDLSAASKVYAHSDTPALSSAERVVCVRAMMQPYWLARIVEDPAGFLSNLQHRAPSPLMRLLLGCVTRGLLYAARKSVHLARERAVLLRVSLHVAVLAGVQPVVRAYSGRNEMSELQESKGKTIDSQGSTPDLPGTQTPPKDEKNISGRSGAGTRQRTRSKATSDQSSHPAKGVCTRAVSIIVPTYNRAALLEECLLSLLEQTITPHQIIVVDDGSEDDTGLRVQMLNNRFDDRITYISTKNGGKPKALNLALRIVTGEWVWLFDDDDVALPDSIESRLAVLDDHPGARVILSNHQWGRTGGNGCIEPTKKHRWPPVDLANLRLLLMRSCFVSLLGALVHVSCYREAGPFREDMITSEDYEMLLRLVRFHPVALLDQATFIVRRHDGERGPADQRYKAEERERLFVQHDRIIGRSLREQASLGEYLVPARETIDDLASMRLALLNRMTVMAGKGLEQEMIEDALGYASIAESANGVLTRDERRILIQAAQQRYLVVRILASPTRFRAEVAKLRTTHSGRKVLGCLARGLIGVARRERDPSARTTLLRMAFHLFAAGLPDVRRLRPRVH